MSTEKELLAYLRGLSQGKKTREWFDEYRNYLEAASPLAVNSAIDRLLAETDNVEDQEDVVAQFIRAVSGGLDKHRDLHVPDGHILDVLIRENRGLEQLRSDLKRQYKRYTSGEKNASSVLMSQLTQMLDLSSHYRKLQYGLFPVMEESMDSHRCTKLMWAIQDDVIHMIRELIRILESGEKSADFDRIFGKMFIKSGSLVYRENRILFPVVLTMISERRLENLKSEIDEYGTAFNTPLSVKGETAMSENISNGEARRAELKDILENLRNDGDVQSMKKRFRGILQDLSPEELAEAEQALIEEGVPVEEVQKLCEVHVAAFEDALKQSSRREKTKKILSGHPVDSYKKENRELKKLLRRFRRTLSNTEGAREVLKSIAEIEKHYARKENQLFPFLEGVGFTGPSKVMWGKHDEIRTLLKELSSEDAIEAGTYGRKGRELITSMKRMIFMEEKILFPTALRKLPDTTWKKIHRGEKEIGFSWIRPGSLWDPDVMHTDFSDSVPVPNTAADEGVELSVGNLRPFQIDLMLKNLPLDITYVDENDRVRYYSQGKERIFPRSPGIIGRDVQNCHPPKSVHVVQKIVEDFKNRRRSEAEFWIQMGGKFIHIRYFPLFEGDVYRGVLEVSQDLTPLKMLEGEKRLLDDED